MVIGKKVEKSNSISYDSRPKTNLSLNAAALVIVTLASVSFRKT